MITGKCDHNMLWGMWCHKHSGSKRGCSATTVGNHTSVHGGPGPTDEDSTRQLSPFAGERVGCLTCWSRPKCRPSGPSWEGIGAPNRGTCDGKLINTLRSKHRGSESQGRTVGQLQTGDEGERTAAPCAPREDPGPGRGPVGALPSRSETPGRSSTRPQCPGAGGCLRAGRHVSSTAGRSH